MHKTALFYFLQKHIFLNHVREIRQKARFRVTIVSSFALLFWVSLFYCFYEGFRFFGFHIPSDFFALVNDYLFGLFYFTLLVMVTFSSAIIAFSLYFYGKEAQYLMTCPLTVVDLFFYKWLETFLFASWAVFFLALPVCFAYGIHQHASVLFYPLISLLFIPFISISAFLGSLAAFFIVLYVIRWRRLLAALIPLLIVAGTLWLLYSMSTVKNEIPLFTSGWLLGVLDYLNFARHPLLPSTWISHAMFALLNEDYSDFAFWAFAITATALFLGALAYVVAEYRYNVAWSKIHTTSSHQHFWQLSWISWLVRLLFFLKPQDRLFLEKDLKIFLRDPLQWGQFGILFGLLLLYILNLRTWQYDQQNVFWKHLCANLNLTATALTICTFASRFIFPLLSLEGKRFWTIGVMPIKKSKILLAKFVFAVFCLVITGESLIFLSCYMLRLPLELTLLHLFTILAISVGVAGLSVGLGAIYPNFKEDSPAKIVSGFGGTLNLVLNLVFVMLMVAVQFVPSHMVLKMSASYQFLLVPFLLMSGIVAVACFFTLSWGMHSFTRYEL